MGALLKSGVRLEGKEWSSVTEEADMEEGGKNVRLWMNIEHRRGLAHVV